MTLRERFWSKVDIRGPDECWPWLGTKTIKGYGTFYYQEHQVSAHRMSFWLSIGPVPKGKMLCHSCDTRPCVNFFHLAPGTAQSNMDDMVARGRSLRGELQPGAKMSDVTAAEILAEYRTRGFRQIDLAARHGVSKYQVGDLVRGNTWKHLPR